MVRDCQYVSDTRSLELLHVFRFHPHNYGDLDVIMTKWLDGVGTLLLSSTSAVLDLVLDPVVSDLQGQLFTCRVTNPYGISNKQFP